MDRARLLTLFRRWSDIEAIANLSPLYEVLGHTVADDPELLDLASQALEGQPPPNVLFAAVHALLAEHSEDPLAAYYPTLGGTAPADPAAAELFRDFCLRHRDALLPTIRTRLVQTNEVRRSALILPAFSDIAAATGRPLAVFEIGPSAGLNLNFDRYHYCYGQHEVGDPQSPLTLECEVRGVLPAIAIPEVVARAGVDLNPLDVTDEGDIAWLRALLWPEHTDRRALLNAAIEVARQHPPTLHKGGLFDRIPEFVAQAPKDSTVCLLATFVLHQFTPDMRERLRQLLLDLSLGRDVYLVQIGYPAFLEPASQLDGEEQVWILRVHQGEGQYRAMAVANPHGRWIDFGRATTWKPWG
jgi:hypothetical protein